MLARTVIVLLGLLAAVPAVAGEPIRIASWKVPALAHAAGGAPSGDAAGGPRDLDAIRAESAALGADVIALQAVGSPQAVRQLFPASDFHLVFSRQLLQHVSEDPRALDRVGRGGGYTAIAVRRGKDVRVQRIEQLGELANGEQDETDSRLLSAGLAVELRIAGARFWLLSVDLAEQCKTEAGSTAEAGTCRPSGHRVEMLKSWIRLRLTQHESFIIAGSLPGDPAGKDAFGGGPAEAGIQGPSTAVRLIRPAETAAKPQKIAKPADTSMVGIGKLAERTKRTGKPGESTASQVDPPKDKEESLIGILVESLLDIVFGIDKRKPPPKQQESASGAASQTGATVAEAAPAAIPSPPAQAAPPTPPEATAPAVTPPAEEEVTTAEGATDQPIGSFLLYTAADAHVSCRGQDRAQLAATAPADLASDYFLIDPALAGRFSVSGLGVVPHAATSGEATGAAAARTGCPIFVDLGLEAGAGAAPTTP